MYRTTVKLAILVVITTLSISCKTKAQTTDTNVEKRQQKSPNGQPPSVQEIFAKMDTNKDGRLVKAEVKGPLQRDFSKIDSNRDGFITRKELAK
jgi:Ca2+-binding EF-hand superfamily protein